MNEQSNIHLPLPSFWPIILAVGITLIAGGVIWGIVISVIGVVVLLVSIAGWALENRGVDQEQDHE